MRDEGGEGETSASTFLPSACVRCCPPPPHRRAEELLKRLCAVDSPRPAVDLEDPAIVARLMRLFHGNAEGAAMEEGVPELDRQQAASMPGEGEE